MPHFLPKVGCYTLSLQIPNKTIQNLYLNEQKIKAAYYNGERVWTEKHRVRWYDNLGNLLKTEWVTDGETASPPNVTDFNTIFYGYVFEGWNTDYSSITSDIDISATITIETAYLFRKGYGINYDLLTNGFAALCTAYDGTSKASYTSVAQGSISADVITCSHTGASSSGNSAFRSMRYRAALLDIDALRAAGYTKINFSGSYSFGAGYAYLDANLRSAFISLQTSKQITTNTSGGVSSSLAWEKVINKSSSGTVSVVSGTVNGSLTLPTTGTYYLIIGELTKAFRGTSKIMINNIWLS